MSCARGVAGGAGAVIGVMGSGVASRTVLGMSSLHIVSATPALLTDDRIRAAYSEGAGIYRILPQAVAVPGSVAELSALVRWAAETRTPLVPRGAGSGMTGGNVGRGVIVDVSQRFRELTVDPVRRLARAGASVTWAEVNAAARGFGLRLRPGRVRRVRRRARPPCRLRGHARFRYAGAVAAGADPPRRRGRGARLRGARSPGRCRPLPPRAEPFRGGAPRPHYPFLCRRGGSDPPRGPRLSAPGRVRA